MASAQHCKMVMRKLVAGQGGVLIVLQQKKALFTCCLWVHFTLFLNYKLDFKACINVMLNMFMSSSQINCIIYIF